MKAILLATALAFGGTAFAQDTTTQTMPPDNPMPTPDGADDMPDTMPPEPMPDATMQPAPPVGSPPPQTETPDMTTTPDPMATPGTMSTVPPGTPVTVTPSRPVSEVFPPPPPKDEYPSCSATVTDGCIQTYEPGIPG